MNRETQEIISKLVSEGRIIEIKVERKGVTIVEILRRIVYREGEKQDMNGD